MNIETAKASIGAAVTYHPQPGRAARTGVITGIYKDHAYVRWHGRKYPEIIHPTLLELANPERTTE